MTDEFRKAYHTDATVHRMCRCGMSYEKIICQLVEEKESLIQELIKLQMIAPMKIIVDGNMMIYRCPDHLVPEI